MDEILKICFANHIELLSVNVSEGVCVGFRSHDGIWSSTVIHKDSMVDVDSRLLKLLQDFLIQLDNRIDMERAYWRM